jgi:hypothetical protein
MTTIISVVNCPSDRIMDSNDFIANETPTGTINGINATFTLANTPIASTVQLVLNGSIITNGTGATITGASVVFDSAPTDGSTLRAFYRI